MERKGEIILFILIFSLFLVGSVNSQSRKNIDKEKKVYVVDTIYLDDPIEVLYTYKKIEVGTFLERGKIDLLNDTKSNLIMENKVFLSESGFLGGDYPKNNCKMGDVKNYNGILYQEFVENPEYFVVLLVNVDLYIDTQSSVDNHLSKVFQNKCSNYYTKVIVPRCPIRNR